MADNVLVGNATGQGQDYTVASDDDGTSQHQYVKLEFGGDGSFTKVSAANPLPVTGTALVGTVSVSSIAAGTNTIGTVARVGATPAGTNVIGTVALTGALPAGSAFLGTIANAGTVAVSSIVTALPAGANTLGTVAISALPSGTSTLGTVAIVVLPAGTNTIGTVAHAGATPAGTNTIGTVALVGAMPAGTNVLGTIAITGVLPAGTNTIGTIAPVGTFTTKETRSSTGTLSHVASSSSVVGLVNTNANRLGVSVTNDATGALYLGLQSNVSTTDYTARLAQYDYWEAPYNYTGTICGLWSTVVASDGAARITEYS